MVKAVPMNDVMEHLFCCNNFGHLYSLWWATIRRRRATEKGGGKDQTVPKSMGKCSDPPF